MYLQLTIESKVNVKSRHLQVTVTVTSKKIYLLMPRKFQRPQVNQNYCINGRKWLEQRHPSKPVRRSRIYCPQSTNLTLPDDASPLDYFALFISLNQFAIWTQYTMAFEANTIKKMKGQARPFAPTCGAEGKAFVASVIWMAIIKSMQPTGFWDTDFNIAQVRTWFPSKFRFGQINQG